MRIHTSLSEIGREAWDGLLAQQNAATPFLQYAFLHALHETGCAAPASGWHPHYLALYSDDAATSLQAAMPLYLKEHSYGEYVFDWAWAQAYERQGLAYYPKLLSSIPFTPVAGNRLLARDEQARNALLDGLQQFQAQLQTDLDLSSSHILFPTESEAHLLQARGMLLRKGVQFHWQNQQYQDFNHFLASLEQKKRKNILAERRKVAQAGVQMRRIPGQDASQADWEFFTRCYENTYAAHFSTPYLNLEFFLQLASSMPQHLLLVIAELDGAAIAASLVVYDQHTLYGRYWGAMQNLPCLHFEAAYYQPLEFCIEQGIQRFEGGAQGEHKMARGFLPHTTWSAHQLSHPQFADAVERVLEREKDQIGQYVEHLEKRNPFRRCLLEVLRPSLGS